MQLPGYESSQAVASDYYPGGGACKPSKAGGTARWVGPKQRESCKEAAEEHRLKINDLIQQTRSADAAAAGAQLAYQQTVVGLAGTLVGFFTLIAAVLAAFYAKRAAEAAERSISHALDTSRTELRAYISSESETVSQTGPKSFVVNVELKNVGATPAHNFAAETTVEFRYNNGGIFAMGSLPIRMGALSPGTPVNFDIPIQLDDDSQRAFNEEKGKIALDLIGVFRDSFGDEWIYNQDMSLTPEGFARGKVYTEHCRHRKADPPAPARKETQLRLPFRKKVDARKKAKHVASAS